MNWISNNNTVSFRKAFTLPEVMAAIVLLALICSGVVTAINRSSIQAADLERKMQAAEVARENMEKIIAAEVIELETKFGISEKYPDIEWQTIVEHFYEPVTSRMWIRGHSIAQYITFDGERKTVEFTHWLTDLTKNQIDQMLKELEKEAELNADRLLDNKDDAALYVGVSKDTIDQWLENGMQRTPDGKFIKDQLDLFAQTGGRPTAQQISQSIQDNLDIIEPRVGEDMPDQQQQPQEPQQPDQQRPNEPRTLPDGRKVPAGWEHIPDETLIQFWPLLKQLGIVDE